MEDFLKFYKTNVLDADGYNTTGKEQFNDIERNPCFQISKYVEESPQCLQ